jgi:hypothetical protein
MQITVKSTKKISEGDNDKGHWIITGVTATDGIKYSGFPKELTDLKPGDVIDAKVEIGEKDGEKYNNIKKVKVVSGDTQPAPASPVTPTPAGDKMSNGRSRRKVKEVLKH